MSQPLTDAINALTTYANEITGQSDTTLSDAVESLVDGYGGGSGSDSVLKTIIEGTVEEINDSDGLIKSIGSYGLAYRSKLVSVYFPSVTEINTAAFNTCTSLASIYFPDAINVANSAFTSCSALTSINFPSVTSIGNYAFRSCSALTSINFPELTNISNNAFQQCSKLTSINLPVVTSIGNYAFASCSKLTSANFPLVTSIGDNAFQQCSALTSINLPVVTSIGYNTFSSCSKLSSVILRKSDAISKLSYTNAFNSTPIASGSGYIYVPRMLIDDYKVASNWSTYANQFRALEDYTVDGTITGELDPNKI